MTPESIFTVFKQLEKDNFSLIYYGAASDDITEILIGLSELNITNIQELSKLRKKVSFLMAECFQNIVRHSEVKAEDPVHQKHFFMTRSLDKKYYIASANLIETRKVESLKEKLHKVNILNSDGLKELYMEVLNNDEISGEGGAGLGIIEMARKSGEKLGFDFQIVDDKYSYFYLHIQLKGIIGGEQDLQTIDIESTKAFQQFVDKENIFLIHRDNFTQESIKPVLRMVENNMQKIMEHDTTKKLAYHLLVEVLQNITKHGLSTNNAKDGVFIMSHKNPNYFVNAGNYIANDKIEHFKAQLNELSQLTRDQLNSMYRVRLRTGMLTEGGGAGLGLIDIFRESTSAVQYSFFKVDDHKSFFGITAQL